MRENQKRKLRGREEVLERWMQLTLILQLYFYTEDVPVPRLPPSSSTPFVLSLSVSLFLSIPLSLVYWLHSELLHKSAFISACLIVRHSHREASVTLHTFFASRVSYVCTRAIMKVHSSLGVHLSR